jgi:hypothetical protein
MSCAIAHGMRRDPSGGAQPGRLEGAVPGVLAHVTLADRGLDVRLANGDRDAAAVTYERAVALLEPP